MGYLAMLVSWEVWKERNAVFFKESLINRQDGSGKIKDEALL
jgi:hypothetical protein